jgi:hypothetical protein
MKATRIWVVALALGVIAVPVDAQRVPMPADGCTYERCLLRLHGDRVVAGLDEREVAEGGLFSVPELRPMISVSDSAAHYYGLAERDFGRGAFMSILGTTLGVVGLLVLEEKGGDDATANWVGGGMLVSGVATGLYGFRRHERARDRLELSLAHYNDQLPDGPRGR